MQLISLLRCCSIAVALWHCSGVASLAIEQDERVLLWPDGAPEAKGDKETDRPSLTVHLPSAETANGAAVIVNPGGGYQVLASDHEGLQIARDLNRRGVAAFVLQYRLLPDYEPEVALLDAKRAVRYVRHHAEKFRIDPDRVGMLGFSAGGHLTAAVGTSFDVGNLQADDPIEREGCRPDFLVPVYPAISEAFFPEDRRNGRWGNLDEQVTTGTPPTFLVHSHEDGLSANHSVSFYQALLANKVQAELHVFGRGPHGTGMAPGDPDMGKWPDLLGSWMRRNAFLTGAERQSIRGKVVVGEGPLYWGWLTLEPLDDHHAPVVSVYIHQHRKGVFELGPDNGPCPGRYRVRVHEVSRDFSAPKTGRYSMKDAVVHEGASITIQENHADEVLIEVGSK